MKLSKPVPSMLTRILVILTAVILLSVLLMFASFALSSRQAQTQSKVNALKVQAYDIAYLAGSATPNNLDLLFPLNRSATRQMMERKLRTVYEEYQAYCLVVDRSGRLTSYFSQVINENQELASQLNANDISQTLARVLMGEEVILQTKGETGPMFTVAVPWIQNNAVVGAVYIQTAAQTIQASYAELWKQAMLSALFTFFAAAGIALFYTRRVVTPLKDMAVSASLMAKGLPAPAVENTDFAELNELAASFNHMSAQIQRTEENRKAFIANLSHELRSPMTSIQGFVQGLLDETVKPEDQKQTLQILLDESKRLNHLVSGLMSLSRFEATEEALVLNSFNICELIRLVLITRLNLLEQKHIQVQTMFEEDDMYVKAEKNQIEQVLINLLDNAIRFTPSNGKITISTQTIDKKTISVMVADNGSGIADEDRERVFDRFYKADQSHTKGDGVGLGLAIVKAILDRHGQTIALLPSEEGAVFRFTLEKSNETNGRQHASESAR